MIHNNWLNHPENNLNIIIWILSGHYLTFLRGNKTWHPPIWVLINCQGRIICLVLWKSPNARTVENVKSAYHHLFWGTGGDVIPTQANVKTYFWEIGQEMGKPIGDHHHIMIKSSSPSFSSGSCGLHHHHHHHHDDPHQRRPPVGTNNPLFEDKSCFPSSRIRNNLRKWRWCSYPVITCWPLSLSVKY